MIQPAFGSTCMRSVRVLQNLRPWQMVTDEVLKTSVCVAWRQVTGDYSTVVSMPWGLWSRELLGAHTGMLCGAPWDRPWLMLTVPVVWLESSRNHGWRDCSEYKEDIYIHTDRKPYCRQNNMSRLQNLWGTHNTEPRWPTALYSVSDFYNERIAWYLCYYNFRNMFGDLPS